MVCSIVRGTALAALLTMAWGCGVSRERVVLIEPEYSYLRDEPRIEPLRQDASVRADTHFTIALPRLPRQADEATGESRYEGTLRLGAAESSR